MSVAAIAAFAAAGISLVNVLVTSQLTRHGQREQWRRETERPLVASFLSTSDDCLRQWAEAAEQLESWRRSREPGNTPDGEARENLFKTLAEAWALHTKSSLLLAELDLVAGIDVRRAAEELVTRQERIRYSVNPAGGISSPSAAVSEHRAAIRLLRAAVVTTTRVDIGVDGRVRPWTLPLRAKGRE